MLSIKKKNQLINDYFEYLKSNNQVTNTIGTPIDLTNERDVALYKEYSLFPMVISPIGRSTGRVQFIKYILENEEFDYLIDRAFKVSKDTLGNKKNSVDKLLDVLENEKELTNNKKFIKCLLSSSKFLSDSKLVEKYLLKFTADLSNEDKITILNKAVFNNTNTSVLPYYSELLKNMGALNKEIESDLDKKVFRVLDDFEKSATNKFIINQSEIVENYRLTLSIKNMLSIALQNNSIKNVSQVREIMNYVVYALNENIDYFDSHKYKEPKKISFARLEYINTGNDHCEIYFEAKKINEGLINAVLESVIKEVLLLPAVELNNKHNKKLAQEVKNLVEHHILKVEKHNFENNLDANFDIINNRNNNNRNNKIKL